MIGCDSIVNSKEGCIIIKQKRDPNKDSIYYYLKFVSGLLNVKTNSEFNVLYYIIKNSKHYPIPKISDEEYTSNKDCYISAYGMELDTENKAILSLNFKISEGTIKNCLNSLCKKKILFKDSEKKNLYYLNSLYFLRNTGEEILDMEKFIIKMYLE